MRHSCSTDPLESAVRSLNVFCLPKSDIHCRFAFVEYESRRDADDAYHEMHNKRIGRDDLLKIEVRSLAALPYITC